MVRNQDTIRTRIKENDPSLTSLTIGPCDYTPRLRAESGWKKLGSEIRRNSNTQLREFEFAKMGNDNFTRRRTGMLPRDAEILCHAMAGNRSIKKFTIDCVSVFRQDNYATAILEALVPFFSRNTCLEYIAVKRCDLQAEWINSLALSLRKFSSLKGFCFNGEIPPGHPSYCYDARSEMKDLIRSLRGHSELEEISIHHFHFDEEFCNSLAKIIGPTARKLTFDHNYSERFEGRKSLDDKCATSLARGLNDKSNITHFSLRGNPKISDWCLINLLEGFSNLQVLNLHGDAFNDNVANFLAASLPNSPIRDLNLSCTQSQGLTIAGWGALFSILQRSNTLECLRLIGHIFNDEILTAFASSLGNNISLKTLELSSWFNRWHHTITDVGWRAMSNTLGNEPTLIGTFNSNHTLQRLSSGQGLIPQTPTQCDLIKLFKFNREYPRNQAARHKIIYKHFSNTSGSINIQPFVDMELKVLSQAIAWACKRSINNNGRVIEEDELHSRSLAFQLCRSIPDLFDVDGRTKKRKRKG